MAPRVSGIDIGLINRVETNLYGVGIGGANLAGGSLRGMVVGGLNVAAKGTLEGAAIGVANVGSKIGGIAVSGGVNIAWDKELSGIAIAPIANYGDMGIRGFAAGAINGSFGKRETGGARPMLRGVFVAGLLNGTQGGDLEGVFLSGAANFGANLRGLCFSGLISPFLAGLAEFANPLAAAALLSVFGVTIVKERARGFLASTSVTFIGKDFDGLAIAPINLVSPGKDVGALRGVQVGALNYAESAKGVQIGVVNYTGELSGLQLGLVNIARKGAMLPFFPIFNAG